MAAPGRPLPPAAHGPARRRSARVTISAVMTRPAAPVQEMTRSAPARAAGRSPRPAVEPDTDAASRSRPPGGAVGDHDAGRAEAVGGRDGERAHRAGAHHEHVQPAERVDRVGGSLAAAGPQPRGGEADPHTHQVRASAVDPGLRVCPSGGAQRERAEAVELPAESPVLTRQGDRLAHLAEDLALADDHGVQPGGHRQQVLDRPVLVVHVQVLGQFGQRDAGMPGQQVGDRGQARVELVHLGVDLHPVAGGHHERARDRVRFEHVAQQLAERVAADGGPFQGRDRGASVAQPDGQHAHGAATADSPDHVPRQRAWASAAMTRP